jgi:hypothetical protein
VFDIAPDTSFPHPEFAVDPQPDVTSFLGGAYAEVGFTFGQAAVRGSSGPQLDTGSESLVPVTTGPDAGFAALSRARFTPFRVYLNRAMVIPNPADKRYFLTDQNGIGADSSTHHPNGKPYCNGTSGLIAFISRHEGIGM